MFTFYKQDGAGRTSRNSLFLLHQIHFLTDHWICLYMTMRCNLKAALGNFIAVFGTCFCCYLATVACTSTAIQLGTYFFFVSVATVVTRTRYKLTLSERCLSRVWCLIWSCDVMQGIWSGQWIRILLADFAFVNFWKSSRPERHVGSFIFFSTTCNQTQLNDSLVEMGL